MPRAHRLSVRTTQDELEHWNQAAHRAGCRTTALWVRHLLTEAGICGHDGKQVCQTLNALRDQLARIGNNLNQLAHSANCGDAVQCDETLTTIQDIIERVDTILDHFTIRRL